MTDNNDELGRERQWREPAPSETSHPPSNGSHIQGYATAVPVMEQLEHKNPANVETPTIPAYLYQEFQLLYHQFLQYQNSRGRQGYGRRHGRFPYTPHWSEFGQDGVVYLSDNARVYYYNNWGPRRRRWRRRRNQHLHQNTAINATAPAPAQPGGAVMPWASALAPHEAVIQIAAPSARAATPDFRILRMELELKYQVLGGKPLSPRSQHLPPRLPL